MSNFFKYIFVQMRGYGYKVCHAKEKIYFCPEKKCDNCKHYIDLLKEINEGSCNDEEVIEE